MLKNEAFLKRLGERIDALRKEQDLSFQEFAYKTDIEKANLVKLTSKGSNITILSLLKISKGLNLPLSEILDFDYGLEMKEKKKK